MLDGTVRFLAIDDERPRALLESEAEAVRAWAEGTDETYERRSEPFSTYAPSKQ